MIQIIMAEGKGHKNSREGWPMTSAELQERLEELVDASSLTDVVEALAAVCVEKSEHLRANWQDKKTAKVWDDLASKLARIECLGL